MFRSLALLLVLPLVQCSTARPAEPGKVAPVAVAFDRSGDRLEVAVRGPRGCSLVGMPLAGGTAEIEGPLAFCPVRMETEAGGSLRISSAVETRFVTPPGLSGINRGDSVSMRGSTLMLAHDGKRIASWEGFRDGSPAAAGAIAIGRQAGGENLFRLTAGEAPRPILPAAVSRIDSFAVSPDAKEIVLSAVHGSGYDVAIVSSDGGEPRWIAPDPADEVKVSWAPRGNKVSWVILAATTTLIRTVHVPTSFQLTVDLGPSDVSSIAWEPKAERLAIVLSSPDAGPRVETLRYGGEERHTVFPPARRLPMDIDVLPGTWLPFEVLAPRELRYGTTVPLVIWTGERDPFAWSDLRASVAEQTGSGLIIGRGGLNDLDAKFWSAVADLKWVDPRRVFIVSREGSPERAAGEAARHGRLMSWPGDGAAQEIIKAMKQPSESNER